MPDLNLEKYDTDKISNEYLDRYNPMLAPWVGKSITLLELGVLKGGSLLLWNDYFPFSKIVGIDLNLPENFMPVENIEIFQGSQIDREFLTNIANKSAPNGFDIIIDDASHIGELTKVSFWHLFDNHLKPGGMYVIEDWGTGYWDDWIDGKSLELRNGSHKSVMANRLWLRLLRRIRKELVNILPPAIAKRLPAFFATMSSHDYGMVGFVKQLVDEQAAFDVTKKKSTGKFERKSKFTSVTITPSIVFILKSDEKHC